jgi:histidine triad (HIT) family protein
MTTDPLAPSVFTRIISGAIPSYNLYEDDYTFAFLAKDEIQLGHSLIVPKVQIDYFVDVPDPHYSAVFSCAKRLAKAIDRATGCKRVGVAIAGWDVPHFHCHLIPMFDYHDLDPRRATQRTAAENAEMQAKILNQLDLLRNASGA